MLITQKNRLKLSDSKHKIIFDLANHNARFYNTALYTVRQHWFDNNEYLNSTRNYHKCKENEHYKMLLTDNSGQILHIIERNFKSFFALLRLKKSGKYSEKVNLPRYKKKDEIGSIIIQGRSARIKGKYVHIGLSKGFREKYNIQFKDLKFKLPTNIDVKKLREVQIIPVYNGKEFDICFIYEKENKQCNLNKEKTLSIDMGLNNFATCFNSADGSSFIVDGRYIKNINHQYNKKTAKLQSIKDHQKYKHTTQRMINLSRKREFQLNDYMNRSSKYIINYCLNNDVGSIVVGDFSDIKQNINLGKKNNQNFVSIPYGKFRQKLKSKCELFGIEYYHVDESYTSKTSFLDKEFPEKKDSYLGKRVKRGLFKSSTGKCINADVNGAAQILVKSKRNIFDGAYIGATNAPVRVKLIDMINFSSNIN